MNLNRVSLFGRASLAGREGVLERFLGMFADVRGREAWTAILLMSNLFILLTAYLIIKTVREPLILASGGAEIKSYAAAGQAILLLLIVPVYGFIATKVNRIKLITCVVLFFISNLVVFYVLGRLQVPLGVVFFLWVGIFNLLVIAQFWSFANDVYTQEQGKRLFALVAFGGSLGAIVGPKIAGWLFEPLGPYSLMLVTAALLGVYLVIMILVNAREKRPRESSAVEPPVSEKPLGKEGAFQLIVNQPYLLLIAVLLVALNLVNTTGEFILGKTVTARAQELVALERTETQAAGVAQSTPSPQRERAIHAFIGEFYANFFFWVSLISALVQLFLVSRIIKYLGVSAALFVLPMIAAGGYSFIVFMPVLSTIMAAKMIENSVDYSLQNTCRHALFLPTSREAKYKAKAAIDSFFVRAGDVLSSVVVFIGVQLALDTGSIAKINIAFAILALLLVAGIVPHYKRLTAQAEPAA